MHALALDDDGVDPPALGATGHRGERLDSVQVLHGEGARVTVTGPMHWESGSMDPMPMIAAEYLNFLGIEITTGDELEAQTEAVLARPFSPGTLTLAGRKVACRSLADGTRRLTIADLDGDRLVHVLTDGSETEPLRLTTLAELPPRR